MTYSAKFELNISSDDPTVPITKKRKYRQQYKNPVIKYQIQKNLLPKMLSIIFSFLSAFLYPQLEQIPPFSISEAHFGHEYKSFHQSVFFISSIHLSSIYYNQGFYALYIKSRNSIFKNSRYRMLLFSERM